MGHTGDTKWVWLSQAQPFLPTLCSRLLASLCLSSSVSSPLGAVRHQGAQVQDLSPTHGTYSVAAANAAVRALLALSLSAPSEFRGFFLCPNSPGLPMVTQNTVQTPTTQNIPGTVSSIPDSRGQRHPLAPCGHFTASHVPGLQEQTLIPPPVFPISVPAPNLTSSWTRLSHTHIHSQEILLVPPTI